MSGKEKTFDVSVEVKIKLTEEDIDDIMCCALEGGICYWCCKAEVVGEYLGEYASDQISRGGTLILHDSEEDARYELTLEKFLNGVKAFVEKGYDRYDVFRLDGTADLMRADATTGDGVVQCALFGDIIYG